MFYRKFQNRFLASQDARGLLALGVSSALMLGTLTSCTTEESQDTSDDGQTTTNAAAADEATTCEGIEYEQAIRWLQQSSEAAAIQLQTFRLATERIQELEEEFQASGSSLQPAIVTDLDETIIDNTALLVAEIQNCRDYSDWENWGDWELNGHPTLIPGALEFLETVDDLGIEIFYISDRTEENYDATLATLQELELPQVSADSENILLLGDTKEARRASVAADHQILMLLGDTMHDFDAAYARDALPESAAEQKEMVEADADHLGYDWIVLPNPTYGTWSDQPLTTWDK